MFALSPWHHISVLRWYVAASLLTVALTFLNLGTLSAQAPDSTIDARYASEVQPLLQSFCIECHNAELTEADIDFSSMTSLQEVRASIAIWQRALQVTQGREMPPKDAKQPSDEQRQSIINWMQSFLAREAKASAGDPGPVVLRRLNNTEYTYTVRDLTGVSTLSPAKEFPVDSAAGEGFTNTGDALVMSPSLVIKYLDAGKEIASHAVLLPEGIRFSESNSASDWTNESLDKIRSFYHRYAVDTGGEQVNLQGIVFDTNQGGRLPLEKYITATIQYREELHSGKMTLEQVAQARSLSPKYLASLWRMLNEETPTGSTGTIIDSIRSKWKTADESQAAEVCQLIHQWQNALWRFSTVGHIGKLNGPKAWQEPVDPITSRQELRWKFPENTTSDEVVVTIQVGAAGDGNKDDFVILERPRLVSPRRQDVMLSNLGEIVTRVESARSELASTAYACLQAAAEIQRGAIDLGDMALEQLARKHGVEEPTLMAWLNFLGVSIHGKTRITDYIDRPATSMAGFEFVNGWVGDDALSIVSNSSDNHVRIPGNLNPHSVAVHPSPTQAIVTSWQSPIQGSVAISAQVQHAHPECGNGVAWSLELRRGNTRQSLERGIAQGSQSHEIKLAEPIGLQVGDFISMVIAPQDGNHSCDLTMIDLTINTSDRQWSLSKNVSQDITSGNPHADRFGNPSVWHFHRELASQQSKVSIPSGSILANWQAATADTDRESFAMRLKELLQTSTTTIDASTPDGKLLSLIVSADGPMLESALQSTSTETKTHPATADDEFGILAERFGKHPNGSAIEPQSLCLHAPTTLEIRLPKYLASESELVMTAFLHPQSVENGSVQIRFSDSIAQSESTTPAPDSVANQDSSDANTTMWSDAKILVADHSAAANRVRANLQEFREWFPIALCYSKIVPVDEVVTLTLFYREDEHLQRLMLTDTECQELDGLWSELHFVSRDAIKLVDAYEQLWQYATQDADPSAFEPLREPILKRAAEFEESLKQSERFHLDSVLEFAAQAFRRELNVQEPELIRHLYRELRDEGLQHDDAIRLTIARILVSPTFLYRLEQAPPGTKLHEVSPHELATRLSYFLWSSLPDQELRQTAVNQQLSQPETLVQQTKRMLKDDKSRRFAEEFFCQWLHILDFDQSDEKSESQFPQFAELKDSMYEESILFFSDLVQNDGSILELLDADHTFVNQELANHYGIPGVETDSWQRVDGVRKYGRGGVLTLASILATQSGASRTSPILRGNWLCEVLLGDKLPKPPKNVPQLAETAPEGKTERQLIELHSSDPACNKCHARIDPFGFALENYDAIGRYRQQDSQSLPINSETELADGTKISGIEGLRQYLINQRKEDFVRQFNRKLLGYALGRAVQLSDEPFLDELSIIQKSSNYRLSSTLEAIVTSKQFRMIREQDYVPGHANE